MVQYSAVIPVYNGSKVVGMTIDRVVSFFETHSFTYEIILVNDGSQDDSWQVLQSKVAEYPHIHAINLLKNYGQHTAILCGLVESRGEYAVTLDDDLQNPPEEIIHLIEKARSGNHDLVFGEFHTKQHAALRRLGSLIVRWLNQRIFGSPPDLILSNFRLIRRDVVDRICDYQTTYPYITGIALWVSGSPANVPVAHAPREDGKKTTYSPLQLVSLVARILFSYSAFPLRLIGMFGVFISAVSFVFGTSVIIQHFMGDISVPGWTTLVVLISFFNGISMLIMSMIGEYTVRLVQQTSTRQAYHIKERLP